MARWLLLLLPAAAMRPRRMEAAGLSVTPDDFDCPCNGLALESQLARMVAVSYDEKGIRSLESYAKEIFSCYSWSDFYYHLPNSGLIQRILARVHWTTPTVLVGRCAVKPKTCTVAFSGATGLNFVAGIMDSTPVSLTKRDGRVEVTERGYRFHGFYWTVYEELRNQVGDQVMKSLQGCEHITATGHSIGAALAAVFQWEHLDRGIQQITMGQNVAWYGKPPDVGCRGKRLYSSDDPVPYLRQFTDGSDVIRHARVPPQMLTPTPNTEAWTAAPIGKCWENLPMDEECVHGCSPLMPHYNLRIARGIVSHQASVYITATDAAFSHRSSASSPKEDLVEVS